MALEFTYRITSDIPWADVVEQPDKSEVSTAGQNLIASGNHVVSDPVDVDANTREWTLTFPSYAAWEEYKAVIIDGNNSQTTNTGFTVHVIAVPTP